MQIDPQTLLELARQRQRDIARAVADERCVTAPAPAIGDVARSWILAVRTTRDYVRALVTGAC